MRAPEYTVGGVSTSSLRAHGVAGYLHSPPTIPSPVSSTYRGPGGPLTRLKLTTVMAGSQTIHCACCGERINHGWRSGKPTRNHVLVNVYDNHDRWVQLETWDVDHYLAAGQPHGPAGEFRPPTNILGETGNSAPSFVKDRLRRKGAAADDNGGNSN